LGVIKEQKSILRKELLRKRRLVSSEEYEVRNALLYEQVLSYFKDFDHSCIDSYLPIKRNAEPETRNIINFLLKKDVRVLVSKSDFSNYSMTHYEFTDKLELKENQFGIPEPVSGDEVDIQLADIMLIPLLAFDKKGNRLGYGKGFYDRLLSIVRPETLKVGLSLTSPFDYFGFEEIHDVTLDICITPYEMYRFL
jgi:5-formyltetrahydrofolate cyclo-ligase